MRNSYPSCSNAEQLLPISNACYPRMPQPHKSTLYSPYSLQAPHQCLSVHFRLVVGFLVEVGAADVAEMVDDTPSDEGSTQIKPNQSLDVHVVLVCDASVCLTVELGFGFEEVEELGSLQPNQPGVLQDMLLWLLEAVVPGEELVAVIVGAGAALGFVMVDVVVMVVSSLQPNQPGVAHEVEVFVTVLVTVVDGGLEVVLSSRHPHHPGVLHVSVLVFVALVGFDDVLVVVSLLLLS